MTTRTVILIALVALVFGALASRAWPQSAPAPTPQPTLGAAVVATVDTILATGRERQLAPAPSPVARLSAALPAGVTSPYGCLRPGVRYVFVSIMANPGGDLVWASLPSHYLVPTGHTHDCTPLR